MRQQTQCPVPKHGCKLSLPLWNLTSVLARSAAMSASTDSAAKHQKSARESKAAARHHDLICPAPYQRPESLRVIRCLPVTWQCGALRGQGLISLEGGNRGPV